MAPADHAASTPCDTPKAPGACRVAYADAGQHAAKALTPVAAVAPQQHERKGKWAGACWRWASSAPFPPALALAREAVRACVLCRVHTPAVECICTQSRERWRRLAAASCRERTHAEGFIQSKPDTLRPACIYARLQSSHTPPWPTLHAGCWAAAPTCRQRRRAQHAAPMWVGASHRQDWGALCGRRGRSARGPSRARRQRYVLCRTCAVRPSCGSAQPPCVLAPGWQRRARSSSLLAAPRCPASGRADAHTGAYGEAAAAAAAAAVGAGGL